MFDIGFSELVLIFIVGLVVLGPKRLPIAIRTVMGWVRTIRGLAANVQNELAQELKLQELQESIKKAETLNLNRLSPELEKTVADLKQAAEKLKNGLDSTKNEITQLANQPAEEIQVSDAEVQKNELNSPLVEPNVVVEKGESELAPDEMTALAEVDEEKLSVYYPPDDEPVTQEKGNSNVS
ncbi:twin arginine-targeting protein translocase TatB [Vespertiliibacter pulmonis]|uniref:Sec-independent protein translocase protein TatB n=1 Tax=Vespertiliibacter pulmonis TaxID=1443036 RepID=A0A3N4W060_9PAST|nr:Sec-independent protein translocase protein TatB [Vespertiliibacter pulmonis]QLB20661.1 twin arginine-targeting protein translocase TatB [Vespertiliibacter pulmonis]RPE82797.1 sec-independent protein translocase protein TatB [Vespertiliibacter pulmonis]